MVLGVGTGQRLGGDLRLVTDRRHDAVHDAAVLSTLADGVNAGCARAQLIVDDDPTLDLQSDRPGELDLGTDPDGDHDELARQLVAPCELQTADAARVVDEDPVGAMLEQHVDTQLGHGRRQQRRGLGVELALHQPIHQMHDRRADTELGQREGGLEAEQAAADDRSVLGRRGVVEDPLAVLGPAEDVDAGGTGTAKRWDERGAPGAQHGTVEAERLAPVGRGDAGVGIEVGDPRAQADVNPVIGVPRLRTELESGHPVAGDAEQLAEVDPVIREVRLAAHERDRAVAACQLLADRLAGDPAADYQHAQRR